MRKPSNACASSKVDKIWRRNKNLSCSICPPHGGENEGRRPKHGKKKPKYKSKRRGKL